MAICGSQWPNDDSHDLEAWQTIAPGGDAGATGLNLPSSAIIPSLGITLSATDKIALTKAAALIAADPYVQQTPNCHPSAVVTAIANGTAQLTGPEVEDAVVFVLVGARPTPTLVLFSGVSRCPTRLV